MKRRCSTLTLRLLALLPSSLSAGALEEGRRLTALFYAGDTDPVWEQLSEQMQSGIGSAPAFKALCGQLEAQLGKEAKVLDEDIIQASGFEVYLRTVQFDKVDDPFHVQWAFDQEGKVGGFLVRLVQKEAETKYSSYKTKIALRLPFEGSWFVFWGGRTVKENYHAVAQDQRFAYDFVQVKNGSSSSGDGSRNNQYYCWEKPILAPGVGTVVVAKDGIGDNKPGTMNPSQPLGNHVILDHGNGEYSFLAHLKKGTVKVKAGTQVAAADLLGQCGNSGNSSEPHLHYHLQTTADFGQGEGLPAQFQSYLANGKPVTEKEPVRGQTIEVPSAATP